MTERVQEIARVDRAWVGLTGSPTTAELAKLRKVQGSEVEGDE